MREQVASVSNATLKLLNAKCGSARLSTCCDDKLYKHVEIRENARSLWSHQPMVAGRADQALPLS
jgi:hypothetical protein